ncbi:MAG: DegT/DnrJ/EryC1/StrS family aminotransferase [Candidatus Sulfotelmatobacter sp.]|jgi:dTDP-4-amino-4,6-dideoxygalactose transaminase
MHNVLAGTATCPVPFLDLKLQFRQLQDGLERVIQPLLASANYIEGVPIAEFEKAFASYCGAGEAVAVDSGTAALHLVLAALGIGPGDEVIVPTNTFIATAAAVHLTGARPVFLEADSGTWQMDLRTLRASITPRCRAVIAVHLYGQPLDMRALESIGREAGIELIEDAAQAHGARFADRRVGTFGAASCFSFYPGKNLGAFGDGGAVTTNNSDLAERLRRLRNHGRLTKYEHAEVGFNYRMDALQGAVLNYKLGFLEDWNERRRYWAQAYRERLTGLPVELPEPIEATEPVYHLFTIRSGLRDNLANFLRQQSIETGVHYPIPLHLQPAFRHLGHHRGDFPVAEKIGDEILSLPIFPEMTEQQFEHVCDSIANFFDHQGA